MRLRTRREYQRIMRDSQKFVGRWIIVDMRQGEAPFPKLGITVTRRYGKAHERNRFKRRVREAFRLSRHQFPPSLEIVVRTRSMAAHARMQDIQTELLAFVKRFQSQHES